MNPKIILINAKDVADTSVYHPCVVKSADTFADGNKRTTPIMLCDRTNEGDSGDDDGGGCTLFGGSVGNFDYVSDGH